MPELASPLMKKIFGSRFRVCPVFDKLKLVLKIRNPKSLWRNVPSPQAFC
jgi:hypothetical protein